MALDLSKLAKEMLAAARPVLKTEAAKTKSYAEMEFKKVAQTIISIEETNKAGLVTEEEAKLLLDMQKLASRSVLTTLEGMGVLAAEKAINAALAAVRTPINAAFGWLLV